MVQFKYEMTNNILQRQASGRYHELAERHTGKVPVACRQNGTLRS